MVTRRSAPPPSSKRFWKDKPHMFRNRCTAVRVAPIGRSAFRPVVSHGALAAQTPERRNRIDVQDYTIKAEISPNTQTITAQATVRFVPMDDGVTSAAFELNNALNVSQRGGCARQAGAGAAQPIGFHCPPEFRYAASQGTAVFGDILLRRPTHRRGGIARVTASNSPRFIPTSPTSYIRRAGSR